MSPDIPIDIFLGLDVGKSQYHACALNKDSPKVFDKPLPQLESELAALFDGLQTHGTVLLVVDQPNTIGALPIVGYLSTRLTGRLPTGFDHAKSLGSLPWTCENRQSRRFHHRRHCTNNATHPVVGWSRQRSILGPQDAVRL